MRRGQDIAVSFPGLYLVHQNIPGKQLNRHSHAEHLLFLPLQGEIEVFVDSGRLNAGPGRMIYLPAQTPHSFASSASQGERLICLIGAKAWSRAGETRREPSLIAASQLCKELLFYLLLHPDTKNSSSLIETLVRTLAESLDASCHLLELSHLEGKVRDPRVSRALAHFQEHLGEGLAMSAVAKAAGLSIRSLNRLFSEELGLTPKQVLAQYRVEHAKALLLSGKTSVTEAAFEVGYQSLAQFISVFRQLTGQLPSEVARLGQKP